MSDDMRQLRRKIQTARRAMIKADALMHEVFVMLDELKIDLQVESEAENASVLDDAVSCYIQYGEYGIDNLMSEIETQLDKQKGKIE